MRTGRQKGNRQRRRCITLLEKEGWLVDVVEKTGRFVKVKDLYGLFDLIGLRAISSQIILVQVTSTEPHNHTKLADFKQRFPYVGVCQYVWKDRKGFDVYFYEESGEWRKVYYGLL